MNNFENVFMKHKFLFGFLFLTFLFFIYFHFQNSLGLFFDIPAMFTSVLFPVEEEINSFLMFVPVKARFFNDFLIALPFNFSMIFIKDLPVIYALKAYSTSYFIIHFIALVLALFAAKRTKCYDIAVCAFAFYFLFSVANSIWPVRELHITILFQFILLMYFLSKEKLNKIDLIPISLLLIYMFESFETTVVYSMILFISSLFILKNKDENNNFKFKLYIGITNIFVAIYILLKLYFTNISTAISLSQGYNEWLMASRITLQNLFSSNTLIPIFALCMIIFSIFYNKKFSKKFIPVFIILSSILYILLWKITGFIQKDIYVEVSNYSLIFWFFFPIVILFVIFDYFKIDVNKYNNSFYSNIFVITCIFGILNLLWQINTCVHFGNYTNYLKNLIRTSNELIVEIPKKDYKKYKFLRYDTCFGTINRSIFLSEQGVSTKLLVPTQNYKCGENTGNFYYSKIDDLINIEGSNLKVETKYWNLNDVKEEMIKLGKVKTNN